MEDTPTFNIKFVQIIEKYNVLYDRTMEDYSNRIVQERTWNEVGKEINETADACKGKWKNLRSAYTRYLRHRLRTKSPKKKYYLADYLYFLTPFTKTKPQIIGIPSLMNINDETSNSIHEEDSLINHEYKVQVQDDDNEFVFDEFPINESSITEETSTSNRKRKEIDPLENSAFDHCTSKQRCQFENTEDADFLFLRSLLPDLHRMTNSQKYEFKWKTMKTIGEILYRPPSNYS